MPVERGLLLSFAATLGDALSRKDVEAQAPGVCEADMVHPTLGGGAQPFKAR